MVATLFDADERRIATAVAELAYVNPFLPERVEQERLALGGAFKPGAAVWNLDSDNLGENPNVAEIQRRGERLVERAWQIQTEGGRAGMADLRLYRDLVLYVLYSQHQERFYQEIVAEPGPAGSRPRRMGFYESFRDEARRLLAVPGMERVSADDPAHLFALCFQVRRAFHHIFHNILGASMAAARMRAAVWQSIFTHDPRRYRRGLYARMHEISTLITGPSGTGKDLVADAIGGSAYIPFDESTCSFAEEFSRVHLAINLATLSPTLIESELFGHCKGSFTGASSDRAGYLEGRGPSHTVFLDEIGELDPGIQVKLLRVLQTREFRRIGELRSRHFGGKIIAATNRDLAREIQQGRFRVDLYYRLCSDLIETPTLAAQIREAPDELHKLVLLLARRLVRQEDAASVAAEVVRWIDEELGADYPWPGNVRELEQCVRNVLVRGHYRPLRVSSARAAGPKARLGAEMTSGELTADELLSRYCTLVYAQTGQYEATARRLELDRRTVKRRIDRQLLAELEEEDS